MGPPVKSSLRQIQQVSVRKMIDLNTDTTESPSLSPVWKVLIYDKLGQDIISPLLHVGDLRERGVTVHMHLMSDRQPIPDVPAVYFIAPTPENIQRLASDLSQRLYDSFYINFSSVLPRYLLEELASAAVESDASTLISQVYDQYLNFISPEPSLFSLKLTDSYTIINNPRTSESAIEGLLNDISSSLFSVLVTLDVIPIIRCPKGTCAEAVAKKLESRLRDHLMNSRSLSAGASLDSNDSRPVLILLDRNMDLVSMLNHTWTYATLIHDVLGMSLNRVDVPVEERGQTLNKSYDVDVSDFFWVRNAGNPFPQVAEDVDAEINKYKLEVEQVNKSTGVSSLEEVDPNDFSASTKNLTMAMKQLPELTRRKKVLDMHMNIATYLFKSIRERQLDGFFSLEEDISKMTKATLLETIRDPAKLGEDKLRLTLIYFLSVENVPKEDVEQIKAALTEAGCSTAPLSYAQQIRMYSKMKMNTTLPSSSTKETGSSDLLGQFKSNFSMFTDTLQSTGVAGHFESIMSGVRNLLPTRKDLVVTKTVEAIMDGPSGGSTSSSLVEDFLSLDPKSALSRSNTSTPSPLRGGGKGRAVAFQDAIVFMIGGGNYLEYHNLMEYAGRNPSQKKNIIYGTTELIPPKKFVEQLEKLGSEQ